MTRHLVPWLLTSALLAACSDDAVAPDAGADASADTSAGDAATSDASAGDGDTGDATTSCASFADAVVLGNVEAAALDEISGTAASRAHTDVLWVHNDSGDAPRVFALRTDGTHLGEYRLTGARHVDWEDMALGPGPDESRDYLYLGDVGDNAARDTGSGRASVFVYRVPEPEVSRDQSPVSIDLDSVEAFELVYPEGPHDAEALVVSPSGDLYLLTKENDGMSELYVARAPLDSASATTLARVGALTFGPGATPGGPFATGGDLSSDGSSLLVRTYSSVLLFTVPSGGDLADALASAPTILPAAREMQGESVAWAGDGRGYFTISEFSSAPVHFYAPDSTCAP